MTRLEFESRRNAELKPKLWRVPVKLAEEIRAERERCRGRGVLLSEQRLVQILLQRGLQSAANEPIRE